MAPFELPGEDASEAAERLYGDSTARPAGEEAGLGDDADFHLEASGGGGLGCRGGLRLERG